MDDLMRAIDKRAGDRITDYKSRVASIEVGIIKGTTLAGASVQLEGSGQ